MNFRNLFKGFNLEKREKREKSGLTYVSNAVQAFGLAIVDKDVTPLALSAVYRAVTLISETLASLPFSVKINNDTKSNVVSHPCNLIFNNRTDSNLTFFELIRQLIQSVLLHGDGFAYIYRDSDGNAIKLRFLPYSSVSIEYDEIKDILYYKCTNITKSRIEPHNMIHLKRFTKDGIHGISIVRSAWRTLQISSYSDSTAKEYFSGGGSKKGYLKSSVPISAEQKNQAIADWNAAYGKYGSSVAVLGNSLDFTQLTDSAADSQLLESRKFNVEEIARYFGINPVLLGDLSHSSYSTIEASLLQFLSQTLYPYIIMMEQEFTRKLLRPSEINLSINIDETTILLTDKLSLANYYKTMISSGILSINEVRNDLELGDIDGGDEHYLPYTDLSQNTVGNTNENQEDQNKDSNAEINNKS